MLRIMDQPRADQEVTGNSGGVRQRAEFIVEYCERPLPGPQPLLALLPNQGSGETETEGKMVVSSATIIAALDPSSQLGFWRRLDCCEPGFLIIQREQALDNRSPRIYGTCLRDVSMVCAGAPTESRTRLKRS